MRCCPLHRPHRAFQAVMIRRLEPFIAQGRECDLSWEDRPPSKKKASEQNDVLRSGGGSRMARSRSLARGRTCHRGDARQGASGIPGVSVVSAAFVRCPPSARRVAHARSLGRCGNLKRPSSLEVGVGRVVQGSMSGAAAGGGRCGRRSFAQQRLADVAVARGLLSMRRPLVSQQHTSAYLLAQRAGHKLVEVRTSDVPTEFLVLRSVQEAISDALLRETE